MKIAMVVQNDVSRDSRVQKEAKALIAAGHDLRVFALATPAHPPGLSFIDEIPIIPVEPKDLISKIQQKIKSNPPRTQAEIPIIPGEPKDLTSKLWLFGGILLQIVFAFIGEILNRHRFASAALISIEEWQPDVIHCHDLNVVNVALRFSRHKKIYFVYDSHEFWQGRNKVTKLKFIFFINKLWDHWLEKKACRVCDLFITVSPGIGDIMAQQHKDLERKTLIIRNMPEHTPGLFTGRQNKQLGETKQIYYSGRITTGRNLEKLIYAASNNSVDLKINFLGYGSAVYIESLKSLALSSNVELEIIAPVESTKVAQRLSQATVVFVGVDPIVESYRLSLPNKFFEGLLSGRPVLVPSLPEMVAFAAGFESVFFYDPKDVTDIALKLRLAVEQDFHPERVMKQREELINWNSEVKTLLSAYSRFGRGN